MSSGKRPEEAGDRVRVARTAAEGDAAAGRWTRFLLTSFCIVVLLIAGQRSLGQDEPSEDDLAPSIETAPSSPASPGEAPGGNNAEDHAEARTLLDTLIDGGVVGLLIVVLSMVSVGFIVEHFLTIRKGVLMPEDLLVQLDDLVRQGQIDPAIEVCQDPANHSLVSHVVLAGLERYKGSEFGFAEYKAAVEEAGEDQTGRLYRRTEVLGLIGSIAPMLGLTGTVLGMIEAFNSIAASGGMARPDELAGGIGKALVTTLMGLVVAIPTMVAFSYFRNRIDSLIAEAGKRVEQVLMPLGRRR